jgi:hypothetical protein
MTPARSEVRWLVLLAYPASGLVLGLADPGLGRVAQQLGTRPGVATAVSVNVLLPLVAVALGLVHGRVRGAWLGALGMALGLLAGLAVAYPAGVRDWSPVGLLKSIPPVVVAAALGYALLGTVAALIRRACRPPGLADRTPPASEPNSH